mgnify:CR=1 FL=1
MADTNFSLKDFLKKVERLFDKVQEGGAALEKNHPVEMKKAFAPMFEKAGEISAATATRLNRLMREIRAFKPEVLSPVEKVPAPGAVTPGPAESAEPQA